MRSVEQNAALLLQILNANRPRIQSLRGGQVFSIQVGKSSTQIRRGFSSSNPSVRIR